MNNEDAESGNAYGIDDGDLSEERRLIQKSLRRNRIGVHIIRGFFAVATIGLSLPFLTTYDKTQVLAFVIAVVVAGVGLLIEFLVCRPQLKRFAQLSELTEQIRPAGMFVLNWKILTMNGFVCELTDNPRQPQIRLFGTFGSGKQDAALFQEPTPVSAYFDAGRIHFGPDNVVQAGAKTEKPPAVLVAENKVYLGVLRPEVTLQTLPKLVSTMLKFQTMLFGGTLIVFSAVLLIKMLGSYNDLALARLTRSWPSTPGVIEKSEVKTVTISKGKSSYTGYEFDVEYMYSVDGREYRNTCPWIGYKATRSQNAASDLASRYPQTDAVSVYYDPVSPLKSVLEQGHEQELEKEIQGQWVVLGIMPVALGIVMLILWFVMSRQRKQVVKKVAQILQATDTRNLL